MRALLVRALLMIFVLPSAAAAQSLPLTEAEALARLSPESPRVRAIRAGIDIARAEVLAASRWPNPRVTFDRESVAGITEKLTTVLQPVPITGRRRLEAGAASALLDATSDRANDETRRARADLRLAFAQLVAAQARERELARTREQLQQFASILAKREAAGDAAGFDRLRAEREVLDVEADQALAATDRTQAQATLASFFATTVDPTIITATVGALSRNDLPPVDELVTRAENTRGELRALRSEMDAARFAIRAAGRRVIPEPEILAGTKSSTVGSGTGSVLAVQAVIPLFDRARADRSLAEARLAQADARAESFRLALRAQVAAFRAAVVERRAAADKYRAAAVSGADQIERIAQVSYEAGERGILEVLDAYRTTASARVRQAALDVATREAEIELEFVTSWEIP